MYVWCHFILNLCQAGSCLGDTRGLFHHWSISVSSWEGLGWKGFPGGSDGTESVCSAGDPDLIPGLGRSPREGSGYRLQYSCLENLWTEEHGGLQSMGSQRVGHDWVTNTHTGWIGPSGYGFPALYSLNKYLGSISLLSLLAHLYIFLFKGMY